MCPLSEIDQFETLLAFNDTFYVGIGVWNWQTQEWIDSPPLDVPFTVTNYTG